MTDRERAEQIGAKILRLGAEREALEYAFLDYKLPRSEDSRREPPVREAVKRIRESESFRGVVAERTKLLNEALAACKDELALVCLYEVLRNFE